MSGGTEIDRKSRVGDRSKTIAGWIFRLGVGAGIILLLLVLTSYGLRTPMGLQYLVAPKLEAQARHHGIDLEVGAMNGVGFSGIRLYEVRLGATAGGGRVQSEIDRIDIHVDLWKSIEKRRPVISSVDGGSARARLWRAGPRRTESFDDEPPAAQEDAPVESATSTASSSSGLADWFDEQVGLSLDEIELVLGTTGETVDIQGLHGRVRPQGWEIVDLGGEADVAGVAMSLGLRDKTLYAAISQEDLDERLAGFPVKLELEGVSLATDGLAQFVRQRRFDALGLELHGLTAEPQAGLPVTMSAESSKVDGQGASLRWQAPTAMIAGGDRQYELSALELAYRRDVSGFTFFAEVSDGEGGRVDLEGHWHLPTSLVGVNAWFYDFRWDGTMPWPWGDTSPVRQARVDGAFHGDLDLIHRMLSLDGEATLRHLEVELPFLSKEVLAVDEVRVELPLTVDVPGGALSIVDGVVRLDEAAELGFDARVVEAGGGSHIFDFMMAGEDIDAAGLAAAMPAPLTGMIADTELDGRFGVGVELAGHSAYPESLVMDVNFWGGVQVLEDGAWADREAIRTGDGVLYSTDEGPGTLVVRGQWQGADQLPAHVPAAILAAEDATFYEHDGLDWTGLRMAMVENIKEGALVRGGSTITQQVAKNLFLTHDRTASRKLQEAFLTWRVEESMSKDQILELYLNVVHWGPELYGIYGASHYYFDKGPDELEPVEAVMLASILPSPIRFGGAVTEGYLPSSRADKMRRVLENMRFLETLSWDDFSEAMEKLESGQIGDLELAICADDDRAPDDARRCDTIEVEAGDGEEMTFDQWEVEQTHVEADWMPLTQ